MSFDCSDGLINNNLAYKAIGKYRDNVFSFLNSKRQALSHDAFVKSSLLIYDMAIDKSVGDIVAEGVSLEWTPAAFALYLGGIYGMWRVRVHKYKVGLIAFANESTTIYLI